MHSEIRLTRPGYSERSPRKKTVSIRNYSVQVLIRKSHKNKTIYRRLLELSESLHFRAKTKNKKQKNKKKVKPSAVIEWWPTVQL